MEQEADGSIRQALEVSGLKQLPDSAGIAHQGGELGRPLDFNLKRGWLSSLCSLLDLLSISILLVLIVLPLLGVLSLLLNPK
jgi:hypothetical protein